MCLLLLYPLLVILLFAGCATLTCRLLGTPRLARLPALLYGTVAFVLVHSAFFFAQLRGVLPAVLPFIALVLWGTLFFQWQPRRPEGAENGLEQGFFLSLLAAGLYVVVCIAVGGVLLWLEGPAITGGG